MRNSPWNHNIYYHDLVLRSVPFGAASALDVGCGQGLLARKLSKYCQKVVAIDADCRTIAGAKTASAGQTSITFIEGDVMAYPFPDEGFDVVTAVAVLHHLPLRPALERFRNLLNPGGVLAIIGLYRGRTLGDFALSATAFPTSWVLRCIHGHTDVGAPVENPQETLHEIRNACHELLPGAALRRRLLFRYSLIWHKP